MNASRYPLDIIRDKQIAWRTPAVCPLAVSDKLKAIRELRQPEIAARLTAEPRLAELLWFLQWRSHQPGGLDKFVQDFLLEFPERLQTAEMAKTPRPRSGRYALEDCVRIWGALPDNKPAPLSWIGRRRRECDPLPTAAEQLSLAEDREVLSCAAEIAYLLKGDLSELRKIDLAKNRNAGRLVAELTPEFFFERCARKALEELPTHLSLLCTDITEGFGHPEARWGNGVWYFDGLLSALLEAMEHHEAKERRAIAATTVSKTVLDKFEFAVQMRANVLLAGDARLGKSVTAEAHVRMRPGLCRLVTVPSETSERDFLEAHARAFLWPYDSKTPTSEIKAAVKHIVAHSGLFVAYDEFHFAIPARPRRNGSPPRLDWIRCNVVDRKLGVLFCTTRQGYSRALSDFLKDTKWAIEQWAGRLHDVTLFGSDADADAVPALTPDDIRAIAAHKFPAVDSSVVEEVAAEAYDTTTAPHTVESILLQACWLARKGGRSVPTTADARQAIKEWKLQPAHEAFERRSGPPAIPARPSASPVVAVPSQASCSTAAPALPLRGKTPALPVDRSSSRVANGSAIEAH